MLNINSHGKNLCAVCACREVLCHFSPGHEDANNVNSRHAETSMYIKNLWTGSIPIAGMSLETYTHIYSHSAYKTFKDLLSEI